MAKITQNVVKFALDKKFAREFLREKNYQKNKRKIFKCAIL